MEKSAIQQLSAGYGKLPEQRLLTIQFKGQAETNEAMVSENFSCRRLCPSSSEIRINLSLVLRTRNLHRANLHEVPRKWTHPP
jgi:hypothetical protein